MSKQCQTALRVVQDTEIMKKVFEEDAEPEFVREAKEIVHFLILYDLFKAGDAKVFAKCYEGICVI